MPNLFDALWNALLALLALLAVILTARCICVSERNERAAYYQGRFGLDRETALIFAAEDK